MVAVDALVRGVYNDKGVPVERGVALSREGALHVAQALPPMAELTRRGTGASVISLIAAASLVARPSTVALVTIYNNEPATGKSYIVDRLFGHALVTVANATYGLWAQINERDAAPIGADDLEAEIRGHTGEGKYGGRAIVGINETVVAEGWFPYGPSQVNVTVTVPGGQLEANIGGRLIVPPQRALSLTVVSSNATTTFTVGASWNEVQLDVE